MCGISGFIGCEGITDDELIATCEHMSSQMIHRGPDNSGIWVDKNFGLALGHRRLSILDLTANGSQPMHSKSNRYVIIFNGEIYNHLALRAEINKEKNYWNGNNDTETLLECIECFGIENTLRRIKGMFAFVLWDKKNKTITLARDRIGEKPLYYGFVGKKLIFGSELKSIRVFPGFKRAICNEALALFFRYSYIPAPHSIYKNIFKLHQGTYLTLEYEEIKHNESRNNEAIKPKSYWSIDRKSEKAKEKSFSKELIDAVDISKKLISDSVKLQMISDVPIGSFLSGGIDSSLITSIMQSHSASPIRTFSIGSKEKNYDEAHQAKKIAQHLGTNHTELYLSNSQIAETVYNLPEVYDEPFADSSQIPTILVSSLASEYVKVSLSGDGGDELFGGYNRYLYGTNIIQMSQSVKKFLLKLITLLPQKSYHFINNFLFIAPYLSPYSNIENKIQKLESALLSENEFELYQNLVRTWRNDLPLNQDIANYEAISYKGINWSHDISAAQNMMNSDLKTYLPDDILVKLDRASMSNSLEARVPFLDHDLIEFSLGLPTSMKIKRNKGKYILRKILADYLPDDLIETKKKGFSIPLDILLRKDLREWSEDLISKKNLEYSGYFDANKVKMIWKEHTSKKRNWQQMLWTILMFQSWYLSSLNN